MQNAQEALLSQLKDIHLPEPVSPWPMALGWWLVLVLVAFVIVAGIALVVRYKQRNRYRKQALAVFDQLKLDNTPESLALNQLADLIKRTLKASNNENALIALSSNQAFSELLQQTMREDEIELLTQGRYQRQSAHSMPIDTLAKSVRHWIKCHKL